MRILIFTTLLFLLCKISSAQYFEGTIVYQNTYKSRIPGVTDEQVASMMGSKQEYFISGGNYLNKLNGTFMQWQLYLAKENRLYNKFSNSEAVTWYDGSSNSDSLLNVTTNKKVIKILGRDCDEIMLTAKSGTYRYYYDSILAIDHSLFINHKFGNWYEFVSRSKSLPLKSIIETSQFSYESTAIEISPSNIDAGVFELPGNIEVRKG